MSNTREWKFPKGILSNMCVTSRQKKVKTKVKRLYPQYDLLNFGIRMASFLAFTVHGIMKYYLLRSNVIR